MLKTKLNKMLAAVLIMTSIITVIGKFTFASDNIDIFVNNKEIKSEIIPIKKGDSILLPLRDILESLEYKIEWDDEDRTVTVEKNGNISIIKIGADQIIKTAKNEEGSAILVKVPAEIINNSTMVSEEVMNLITGLDVVVENNNVKIEDRNV